MTKICFSIPVHENPEVIKSQIENIHRYNPDSMIVLHKSNGFELGEVDHCIVNPVSYNTKWGSSFLRTYVSNFQLVRDQPFEYFCLLASNELFFRSGAYEYMSQFDAGVQQTNNCHQTNKYQRAKDIGRNYPEQFTAVTSQVEGLFIKKSIMIELITFLETCQIDGRKFDIYAQVPDSDEEGIFSTFLSQPKYIKGNPITWCEWVGAQRASIDVVTQLLNNQWKTSNDYYTDPTTLFSIKRVERQLNDPVRQYIMSL